MKTRILVRLAFVSLLVFAVAARADLVKVDYATGINSTTSEQGAVTQLVRNCVSELGHQLTEDGGAADYSLQPHLMKLQQSYVLTIQKSEKGKSRYTSQLKAAHFDEMDRVAKRVTRAAIAEKPAGTDLHVGEVTDEESRQGTQRRATRAVQYLSFGGGILSNLGRSVLGYSVSAAQGWDVNRAIIKLFGDLTISGSALQIAAGIGGNLYLTDGDISPYLGADFGYGFAHADSSAGGGTANGFSIGASAGVGLLRTTAINLDLGARLGVLLAETSFGRPLAFAFRVGLYF